MVTTAARLAALRSAQYDTTIFHRRSAPAAHEVRHRMPWWLFDLDELPVLDEALPGFGHNRRASVSFHDDDHFEADGRPIAEKVNHLLCSHGIDVSGGHIAVLTQPRSLGYVFNPVSFWWCERADGTLAAVLAEITNTFGERLTQVLDGTRSTGGSRKNDDRTFLHYEHPKALHVSPFLGLDECYEYRVSARPGDHVAVSIDVHDSPTDAIALRTSMTGRRRPLHRSSALFAATTFVPHRITADIHVHALRLWRKRVPFHSKPPFTPGVGSFPPNPSPDRRPIASRS